jgi:hypothetical protein
MFLFLPVPQFQWKHQTSYDNSTTSTEKTWIATRKGALLSCSVLSKGGRIMNIQAIDAVRTKSSFYQTKTRISIQLQPIPCFLKLPTPVPSHKNDVSFPVEAMINMRLKDTQERFRLSHLLREGRGTGRNRHLGGGI